MTVFSRFESGKAFRVNATRASGKPIEKSEPPKSSSTTRRGFQRKSKATVMLAKIGVEKQP
jgi:hypothetical protein